MEDETNARDAAVRGAIRLQLALESALEYATELRKQLETGEVTGTPLHRHAAAAEAVAGARAATDVAAAIVARGGDDPEEPGRRRRTCSKCGAKKYGVAKGVCPGCTAPKKRRTRKAVANDVARSAVADSGDARGVGAGNDDRVLAGEAGASSVETLEEVSGVAEVQNELDALFGG